MDEVLDKVGVRRAAMPDPAVFDCRLLDQYTAGDEKLEAELIGLFLGQLPQILLGISSARSAADWKFAFHTLKGAAASIGARELAGLAEHHETRPLLDHAGDRASLVDVVATAAERFEREVRRVTL
jgi:HPt (histidine-containing phosphotransfer) domain-containing protein